VTALPKIPLGDSDDAFRAAHVGASEVSALFDCSPWLTRFELWHRKRGTIATPDFVGDERMLWGTLLEPTILDEACRRYGWVPVNTPKQLSNGKGFGGHPDRYVRRPSDGAVGCVEAKAVDWIQFKKWGDEPQLHYLLQPQAYCGLGNLTWCAIVALVGGNELKLWEFDFRSGLFVEMERRVEDFWSSVRANDPPPPDFTRDGDTLSEVLGEPTEDVADLRHDNRADELAREWLEAKEARDAAELRMDVAKCELMMKIGSAGRAMLGLHRIGCNQTKGSPGTLVTPEMVGTHVGARRGYRRFDVKERENG